MSPSNLPLVKLSSYPFFIVYFTSSSSLVRVTPLSPLIIATACLDSFVLSSSTIETLKDTRDSMLLLNTPKASAKVKENAIIRSKLHLSISLFNLIPVYT